MDDKKLGWIGIVRLGLVQTALGAIVILTTSTMNRVMVVELLLPAMVPGFLVLLHYSIQLLRPRWGYGSDIGKQRTPWIIGGMFALAAGGIGAAIAIAIMAKSTMLGMAVAVVTFILIGIGVGACGTSLLVLLATNVHGHRRAAAASIVWIMMIAGFVVTSIVAGHFLDPYSHTRLILVTSSVSGIAVLVTLLAIWRVERNLAPADGRETTADTSQKPSFRVAFAQVWEEPISRVFTIFVFVSMLAYSAQDLILEPFAGIVFGYTPGESTQLAGTQHAGVLAGMILVAVFCSFSKSANVGVLRMWSISGCIASAIALMGLTFGAYVGPTWPLQTNVFLLGFSTGAFAVGAIGSMMGLANKGRKSREGVRMGLWGAAQAIAFALGGFLGAAGVDLSRALFGTPVSAYATVFFVEGMLFLVAAFIAARIGRPSVDRNAISPMMMNEHLLSKVE